MNSYVDKERNLRVYQLSGNEFVENQTKEIEREFKRSRPRPRWWAMGFQKQERRKRQTLI